VREGGRRPSGPVAARSTISETLPLAGAYCPEPNPQSGQETPPVQTSPRPLALPLTARLQRHAAGPVSAELAFRVADSGPGLIPGAEGLGGLAPLPRGRAFADRMGSPGGPGAGRWGASALWARVHHFPLDAKKRLAADFGSGVRSGLAGHSPTVSLPVSLWAGKLVVGPRLDGGAAWGRPLLGPCPLPGVG